MPRLSPRTYTLLAVALLLAGALWAAASRLDPAQQESALAAPQAGFLAPDFTLETLDGDHITLSELRGRPVLVNLWASWCGPCRAEMPAIQRIHDQYDGQFIVLAVNSTSQDSRAAAQAFVDEFGFTFPVLLDTDGLVADLYNLRAYPSSYFVDANGVISEVVFGGPMNEALLAARIEQLLQEAP